MFTSDTYIDKKWFHPTSNIADARMCIHHEVKHEDVALII